MNIAAVGTAFPEHWYDQAALTEYIVAAFGDDPILAKRLRSLHANTGIKGRLLALPLDA